MLFTFQQGQLGRRVVNQIVSPLDNYTDGLWACYGIGRLLSSYSGSLIRVRESGGDTEQDIGFLSDGSLDTTSLASFVGANSGFITTWYDQSGSGNDMLQATTTRQPRIVNAGSYDGSLVFNPTGTDDFLQTTATGSSSVNAKSIFRRYTTRARNTDNILFEYGDGALIATASGANQIQCDDTSSTLDRMISFLATNATGTGYYDVRYGGALDQPTPTSNGVVILKGQTSANTFYTYQGGALVTPRVNNTTGTVVTTGNFPAYAWSLGARSSTASLGAQIDMYSCAIYDADKRTDALAINSALDSL